MPVNLQHPVVTDQADRIIQLLGIGPLDPAARARIIKFVLCNSYFGVLQAAKYTLQRAELEQIDDRWGYTVTAHNGNTARLCHLYGMLHLAENALRSVVDVTLRAAHGSHWYEHPPSYLPRQRLRAFAADPTLRELRRHADAAGDCVSVDRLPEPSAFLTHLSFGWLRAIIEHNHSANFQHTFFEEATPRSRRDDPNARFIQPMRLGAVKSLLKSLKDGRDTVAHNRYMTNEAYAEVLRHACWLLIFLQFDLRRTLANLAPLHGQHVAATYDLLETLPPLRLVPAAAPDTTQRRD